MNSGTANAGTAQLTCPHEQFFPAPGRCAGPRGHGQTHRHPAPHRRGGLHFRGGAGRGRELQGRLAGAGDADQPGRGATGREGGGRHRRRRGRADPGRPAGAAGRPCAGRCAPAGAEPTAQRRRCGDGPRRTGAAHQHAQPVSLHRGQGAGRGRAGACAAAAGGWAGAARIHHPGQRTVAGFEGWAGCAGAVQGNSGSGGPGPGQSRRQCHGRGGAERGPGRCPRGGAAAAQRHPAGGLCCCGGQGSNGPAGHGGF